MLVSTRTATGIEILSSPAALDLMGFPTGCGRNPGGFGVCFPPSLALCSLVEQREPFLDASPLSLIQPRSNNANGIAGRDPVEIVSRAYAVLVSDNLGNG